jgi:hypothetical protein
MELVKLARKDRQHFDCAIWLHRAREIPQKQFKQEVEKELTGRETEPWEIIYFKLYESQMPVIGKRSTLIAGPKRVCHDYAQASGSALLLTLAGKGLLLRWALSGFTRGKLEARKQPVSTRGIAS